MYPWAKRNYRKHKHQNIQVARGIHLNVYFIYCVYFIWYLDCVQSKSALKRRFSWNLSASGMGGRLMKAFFAKPQILERTKSIKDISLLLNQRNVYTTHIAHIKKGFLLAMQKKTFRLCYAHLSNNDTFTFSLLLCWCPSLLNFYSTSFHTAVWMWTLNIVAGV